MSAFSVRVVTGVFASVDTGFRIPSILAGTLIMEHSSIPAGMSLTLQGDALFLIGASAIGDFGDWPILVRFFGFDGAPSALQLPILGLLSVDSAEELVSEGMPDSAIELGDFYYILSGGPLRREMRDGF